MEVERAELRHQTRGVVLAADGAAARDQHDFGVAGGQRGADRLGLVGEDLEGQQPRPVPRQQRAQHHRVAVHDARPLRQASGGQQLVAGDDQAHAGPAHAARRGHADGGQQAGVLGPQAAPGAQHGLALADVLAHGADVPTRRHGLAHLDMAFALPGHLGHHHGVGAPGQRGPGHDAHRGARSDLAGEGGARQRLAQHPQRDRVVGPGSEGVLAPHGVAVHGGPREAGHVHRGLQVFGQHPARALQQRHGLVGEADGVLAQEGVDLLHVGPLGESPHADVPHGGSLGKSYPVALIAKSSSRASSLW